MTKPLLPAGDAAGSLREAGFALLIRERRPVGLDELAAATGLGAAATREAVATLAGAGWLDVADGRVAGAAGLSLATGPHRLTLGGARFRTWCAYDALGIVAALAVHGRLRTACGQCGIEIALTFRAGMPDRSDPERLWLAEAGADLRGSFCTPTVLLCGDQHGTAWAAVHDGRGRLLDLDAASRAGGADWAGCAAAARRLA